MKSESSKKISLLKIKTIDSEIKNLRESIEKSESFRLKLKEKSKNRVSFIALSGNNIKENFLDSTKKMTENKNFENTSDQITPTSKKVMENYGKFSINFTGVPKSSRNYFNIKGEEYNPYKTNYGVNSRHTIDNIYDSFDHKKNSPTKSGINFDIEQKKSRDFKLKVKLPDLIIPKNSSSIIKSPSPNKKSYSNYQANTTSSRTSNKKLNQTNQHNTATDMESKLIYSKVFNKKYDILQNSEKKVLAREALSGKDLTYEKQLFEMKSKIHFIKEVYNYAYPKIMIEKVRQMKKILNENKGSEPIRINSKESQSSKEQVTITHSKLYFYL